MKKGDLLLKMRIGIGETIQRFCPEILLGTVIYFFRLVRVFFSAQIIPSEIILNLSQKDTHVFFGYYDITPFNNDDGMLLAMHAPLINKTPGMKDEAEVGFYKIDDPEHVFFSVGETNTWCWQQGCRLQWHPVEENWIIYNCMIDGEYGAIIKDIASKEIIREIKKPLYSVSSDGQSGLSLDFSRLQRLRPGYGYGILPDKNATNSRPDHCGIELIDLKTNEFRQIISLKKIAQITPHDSMDGAEHYFNHLMFNPLGSKFLFFHLWIKSGKRYSRMFVADKNGNNIKLLNNSGSVSHYNWISDDEIVLYSLIKDGIVNGYKYAIFNSLDEKIICFGKNITKKDGHPTFLKNKGIFITDTYPDLLSQRSLLSYNLKKDEVKTLARFDSSRNFAGEFRCDLHPRISNNERMICVDRLIDNRRNISVISINAHEL